MAANTLIAGSISTGPQFQAPYVTLIPYPGAPGSLFFEKANVSELLERWSVIGFSGLDWTKICTNLEKEYKDQDIAQQISSRAYLEVFKDKPRTENAEVLQFYCDYSEISKELLEKGKLDKYTQLRWFPQGLPSSI